MSIRRARAATAQRVIDLRCASRYHCSVAQGATGLLRVQCRYCRRDKAQVVYHWFDLASGELIDTQRFASVRAFVARHKMKSAQPFAGRKALSFKEVAR